MSETPDQKSQNKSREELLIDLSTDRSDLDEAKSPDEARRSSQSSLTSPKVETPTNKKLPNEPELEIKEDHFPREHVVDARDTLDKVAAMHDTTPTRLAQYNKLTSRFIFAGQVPMFPTHFISCQI